MLNNLERDLGPTSLLATTPDRHCISPSRAHPLDPHSWTRPAIAQGPQLRVDGEEEQESTGISPKPEHDAYNETNQRRRRRECHHRMPNVGPAVSRIDGCPPAGCG